ncbi:hypothetical protein BRM1_07145 [Brevibacterium sp. BRM-1]|uniref:hypothetical protein n=1 Tax=Brevibacterium sp. BRM-1 TaxID=2999062 RepID=UPI00227E986A|nr:hypothetical protein [Brevibacterium sp. BRM-1]WAL39086.1 hypothetical protein BRM1_07145 [Brevibacterium sp. BRM-1]
MVRPLNTAALARATGMGWEDIVAVLEAAGGSRLDHGQLVAVAAAAFAGRVDNPGWWAQAAALGFEQRIGRRLPGQRADGTFSATASRTVALDRAAAYERVVGHLGAHPGTIAGHPLSGPPRTSRTAQRSFWRADLERGERIELGVAAAAPLAASPQAARALVTAGAEKVPDPAAAEAWRADLRALLAGIFG